MSRQRLIGKKLIRSLLPIALLIVVALAAAVGWIVYSITQPLRRDYLVTPQSFTQISGPVMKAEDAHWRNRDGTEARGWLLKGPAGAPAVVLLHRYGADRSWLFNFGVKLHEATGFTILWPDLRGHGLNPPVKWSSFGKRESEDVLAAFDYLTTLKSDGLPLLSDRLGVYGVELGAYAGMRAAMHDPRVRVLALDSVPFGPDELVRAAANHFTGDDSGRGTTATNNRAMRFLIQIGMRLYLPRSYDNLQSCDIAATLRGRRVFLLSGTDAGYLRDSTAALARCFQPGEVESATELPLTGLNLPFTNGEQEEGYDRQIIEFFSKTLRPPGQ
jgi:pimeloyl-ACP methyl ester carboxylesterase